MGKFQWDRQHTLVVADSKCTMCQGMGMWVTEVLERRTPCNCALRGIFRACHTKYRTIRDHSGYFSRTHVERCSENGAGASFTFGHKDLEFSADFELIAKRTLGAQDWQLFKLHFLEGADWKVCARKLGMARGNVFHRIYAIQAQLGRAYRETQPHALYPIDEYYSGTRLDLLTRAA